MVSVVVNYFIAERLGFGINSCFSSDSLEIAENNNLAEAEDGDTSGDARARTLGGRLARRPTRLNNNTSSSPVPSTNESSAGTRSTRRGRRRHRRGPGRPRLSSGSVGAKRRSRSGCRDDEEEELDVDVDNESEEALIPPRRRSKRKAAIATRRYNELDNEGSDDAENHEDGDDSDNANDVEWDDDERG